MIRATTPGDITCQVVADLPGLRALEPAWAVLGRRFPTPLLQHEWFLACAETLHQEEHLRVVVVRRRDTVVGLAPLVLAPKGLTPWLEILGSSRLHEPAGLLYEDEQALDSLVDAVVALGRPVLLERLVRDSPVLEAFRIGAASRPFVVVRQTGASCFLKFENEWDAFLGSLGAKWRAGYRSKQRKAQTMGDVAVEEHRPARDELPRHLELAFAIEASSWKGRAGSSLLHNATLRRFFERYAEQAARRASLRVYFYRIGTETVAMRIAVEHAGRLWFLKTGYSDAFARLSPGIHLTMEIIKRGMQLQLDGCEFLGSEEPWQHAWPVGTHRYASLIALPRSLRGLLGSLDVAGTVVRHRLARRKRAVVRHEVPVSLEAQ